MPALGVPTIESLLLLLLLAVVAFAALARRLHTPYPIILVIAGLLLAFVPAMPRVTLDPDIVFLVVLPPLLYSAAWNTSWQSFRHNLVSIALLAIGLVAFTVAGVAAAAPLLLPGFDWRAGFVLGAVVAPTDAIAAVSIAKRVRLPKRIVDILEGESLVNDATGLLALEFAMEGIMYGQIPAAGSAILRLIYLSAAGIGVGLALARIVQWFELRIDDGPIEIAISFLVPYAAYLAADAIHASGVLAVVAAGLYLARQSSRFFSPSVRLQANAVWNALMFILNGVVFILIGLQLPYVRAEIRGLKLTEMAADALLFSACLICLRLLWTFPAALVANFIRRRILRQDEPPLEPRRIFIVGWTGMRGVIALAAAMSVPAVLSGGNPFPQRNAIVFLSFSAILVTLVLQGLALPRLIRALGLAGTDDSYSCELQEARRLMIEAALAYLERARKKKNAPVSSELYDDLAKHYQMRLATLARGERGENEMSAEEYDQYIDLSRELLDVERDAALRLRAESRIDDNVLREIEHELDLIQIRLKRAAAAGALE